jgi:hypothetical protein
MNPPRRRIWVALQPKSRPKVMPGWGATPGVSMSGHLRFRFCFVAFLLVGLSTSPASSNPFDALFNSAPAPAEATAPAPAEATAPAPTAPAPAEDGCLPQPGKSTAEGQHWVYRYDGHRKCWFQAAETAVVKKSAHHAARPRAADSKENDSAPRNRRAVVDARTELLGPTSTEAPQPTPPPAPQAQVVDAAPVPAMGGGAPLLPSASVVAEPATNRLTADQPMPGQVDVEALLAAAPPTSDSAAAASPAGQIAAANPHVGHGGGRWTATLSGLILIALGLVFLLRASQTVRVDRVVRAISPTRVDRVVRAMSPTVEAAGGHRSRRVREPAFAFSPTRFDRAAFDRPADKSLFRPPNARPAISKSA